MGRTPGSHLNQPRHLEIQDTLIWVAGIANDKVAEWKLYYDNGENRAKLGANPETRVTKTG